jgi:hypothetical protein
LKLKDLKEYLIGDGEYLLKNDNNGKTVMLSGVWGSGKTHFWQNEIEPELSEKLKRNNKACVYVSLYGKDNIEAIKNEILFKAYESIKDENKLAKRAISAFGFGSRLLSVSVSGIRVNTGVAGDAVEGFFGSKKIDDAKSFLADGGLICLDDFERKSKHVDLNDLFGFITQQSIDMNCKVVIILNSDVFEGKEANVFKTVKEKTVNKFFYFEPTLEELFISIYEGNEKYKVLDEYKDEILKAVKETKELNARIYIQVLDNCLEWLNQYEYNKYQLRALVIITTNFIKNHFVFEYRVLDRRENAKLYKVLDKYYQDDAFLEVAEYFIQYVPQIAPKIEKDKFEKYLDGRRDKPIVKPCRDSSEFLHSMHSAISKKEEDSNGKIKSDSYYDRLDKVFQDNKDTFKALYFYAYVLNVEYGVDKEMFDKINQFVKTGILLKDTQENK